MGWATEVKRDERSGRGSLFPFCIVLHSCLVPMCFYLMPFDLNVFIYLEISLLFQEIRAVYVKLARIMIINTCLKQYLLILKWQH